jgi:hypothetical protein
MARTRRIYGEVNNETDLKQDFAAIRKDVDKAGTRAALTELHRRAGYLVTLTQAPSWKTKFGDKASDLRDEAEREFAATAREVNR